MSANDRQVGGNHYKQEGGGEEHWDRVARLGLDYFQARITAYVERAWKKNGVQDLEKARHFLDKYIEIHTTKAGKVTWEGKFWTFRLNPPSALDASNVSPSAWIGFTFEGADSTGFLFTCKLCNTKFYADPDTDPNLVHERRGLICSVASEQDAERRSKPPLKYDRPEPFPQPLDPAEAGAAYVGSRDSLG